MMSGLSGALDRRSYILEFLAVVAVVLCAGAGATVMALAGVENSAVLSALLDVVKVGFGAVIALAYAARGGKQQGP